MSTKVSQIAVLIRFGHFSRYLHRFLLRWSLLPVVPIRFRSERDAFLKINLSLCCQNKNHAQFDKMDIYVGTTRNRNRDNSRRNERDLIYVFVWKFVGDKNLIHELGSLLVKNILTKLKIKLLWENLLYSTVYSAKICPLAWSKKSTIWAFLHLMPAWIRKSIIKIH